MLIQMQGINKAFGPVKVLEGVDFALERGEIHALMGENGAGKSTLMKILTGIYPSDAGRIHVDGREVHIHSPKEAEALGIAIIHQELNLIPQLSVVENLFLGREKTRGGLLKSAEMHAQCLEFLALLGIHNIDPQQEAGTLSVGRQQMVEIAKALSLNAQVLIMDEPTAALSHKETEVLFTLMHDLKSRGVGIVYVSHRMEEIFQVCDRISVLRDGQFVGSRVIKETRFDEIVKMMVGREMSDRYPSRSSTLGPVRFKVEGLCDTSTISDISFEIRQGEVLGVAGLMGAGRSEIAHTLFGLAARSAGNVWLDGQPIHCRSAIEAISHGIGYVTEDRKTQGLVLSLSVKENISLTKAPSHWGVVNSQAEDKNVSELIAKLSIRTRDADLEVKSLSGGNQQKVVFAKWLGIAPKVLFLDEPTRGVDVGGKAEIYHIINQLAASGVAILMISSELPEVLAMSDRILVMHQGNSAGIFDAKTASQESIMHAATGGQ
ncbi:sugar ABC transporter ATP-binding protein [Iodobacter fluviatilis]|uniref:D-xylose ABC transporter ATP-binding protein n=1 Tax=Iodobacter fluviatilis TaxID=537 RepID=A0A7G3GBL6_9NEIS|nr:sugar ABC transporter ATP-binding protein [Iodobacter fluviatilis]QBC44524.1 D-xylose ABC transporter ATP-binding protein [Iodobacter fluviatilis]